MRDYKGGRDMQNITVYDTEAEDIKRLAEDTDTTEAEVVQAIFDAIKDNGIKVEDYL